MKNEEKKLSIKKLSKQEKNQNFLSRINEKKDEIINIELDKKLGNRTFLCTCGCKVTLHGNIDERLLKCSQCYKK